MKMVWLAIVLRYKRTTKSTAVRWTWCIGRWERRVSTRSRGDSTRSISPNSPASIIPSCTLNPLIPMCPLLITRYSLAPSLFLFDWTVSFRFRMHCTRRTCAARVKRLRIGWQPRTVPIVCHQTRQKTCSLTMNILSKFISSWTRLGN